MFRFSLLLIASIALKSCIGDHHSPLSHFVRPEFDPALVNTPCCISVDSMIDGKAPIICIEKFGDTCRNFWFPGKIKEFEIQEKLSKSCNHSTDGLTVFVDEQMSCSIERSRFKHLSDWSGNENTFKALVGYIINETPEIKKVFRQDEDLYVIQEAQDSQGFWCPIEYWSYAWCGVSYSWAHLEPGEYLAFRVPVYEGNFKTQLRLKLNNGNTIYHSEPFIGSINYNQFKAPDFYFSTRNYNYDMSFFGELKIEINRLQSVDYHRIVRPQ